MIIHHKGKFVRKNQHVQNMPLDTTIRLSHEVIIVPTKYTMHNHTCGGNNMGHISIWCLVSKQPIIQIFFIFKNCYLPKKDITQESTEYCNGLPRLNVNMLKNLR
jgi:hypothetical protein